MRALGITFTPNLPFNLRSGIVSLASVAFSVQPFQNSVLSSSRHQPGWEVTRESTKDDILASLVASTRCLTRLEGTHVPALAEMGHHHTGIQNLHPKLSLCR